MADYAERIAALKDLNDAWKTAPTDPNELPPDGPYEARVNRFDFFTSKDDSDLFLKTEMNVVGDGPFAGRAVDTVHCLTDERRLGLVKRHLDALRIVPESLADLQDVLPGALDAIVEVVVKTSDRKNDAGQNYRNVYVNGRLDAPSDLAALQDDPQAMLKAAVQGRLSSDDDLPF